jgi:hypothetical protein
MEDKAVLAFILLCAIIFIVSGLISGGLLVVRRQFGHRLKDQEYVHSSVFSFFTTLYAFFIGFAIVTLWSAFLSAKTTVNREAEDIIVAYRTAQNLPNGEGLRQALKKYVKVVLEDEWPQMGQGSMSEKAGVEFDKVLDHFYGLSGDATRIGAIFDSLASAGRQRLSRGTTMRGNLYPPVWMILILGFGMVIFGFYLINRQYMPGSFTFEFLVIVLVLSCLYFIYDIDTPFSGLVNVAPEAFEVVYKKMLQPGF